MWSNIFWVLFNIDDHILKIQRGKFMIFSVVNRAKSFGYANLNS